MNWNNVLERALWTAVQAQPVVFVLDLMQTGEVPTSQYLVAAGVGFAASALKTIATERMKFLK